MLEQMRGAGREGRSKTWRERKERWRGGRGNEHHEFNFVFVDDSWVLNIVEK